MFFSLTLVIQFALLWSLLTFLAHEDPQSSLTMTMKIVFCLFLAKLALHFAGIGTGGVVSLVVEVALVYLLIWWIADTTHKTTAYISISFLLAMIVVQLLFSFLASSVAKSLSSRPYAQTTVA
jgi:hypothetical protein